MFGLILWKYWCFRSSLLRVGSLVSLLYLHWYTAVTNGLSENCLTYELLTSLNLYEILIFWWQASVSAIYDATQKIFWSLANCWILFAITKNSEEDKHTLIERFFSHKFFKFVGRLTLVAYMMHPIVQSLLLSSQQQHLYSSTILMVISINWLLYSNSSFDCI